MANQLLKDWAKRYYKHRDVILKKIKSISDTPDGFVIMYSDKQVQVQIVPDISNVKIMDKPLIVVTLNTGDVVPWFDLHWKELIEIPSLQFLVVNPFSKNETRWHICPSIHNRIADETALKLGLLAMGELVDVISIGEWDKKTLENHINA